MARVVAGLPRFADSDLLVGAEHFSDAGVYRIAPDVAMVQTVDFFAPIVDDPFVFGQIAAANALSDVYAMGASPRTAMNIVAFPEKELGLEVLAEILRGGAERVLEAGAVIVGGHSVRDAEVKYGLAVTGLVDPARMMTNAGARAGDALVLTKRLGTGFVTTAAKRGTCPAEILEAACASMTMLNRAASEAAVEMGVLGATDITGFGLAGHAVEMAEASNVTLVIELSRLPVLPGVESLIVRENYTGANEPNRAFTSDRLRTEVGSHPRMPLLFDPQTSGGLLVSIAADRAEAYVRRVGQSSIIGHVEATGEGRLYVKP